MKKINTIVLSILAAATSMLYYSTAALAGDGSQGLGLPKPWQLGMQDSASPLQTKLIDFHDMLLVIITAITIFVMLLLAFVMFRFSAKRNPKPSTTTHNVMLEVVWTLIPVIILVIIVIPSIRLLYFQDKVPEAAMTVKAIGYQWYWGYEYPDHGDFSFNSYMVQDEDLKEGQPRLLATDTAVVLPVDTVVRLQVTAADVLHAWAVPALGVKIDAVPGQLNEIWFKIDKEGMYYGQCSELCGVGHGFMPIMIKAVSQEEFEAWVEQAKEEFAEVQGEDGIIQLAYAGAK